MQENKAPEVRKVALEAAFRVCLSVCPADRDRAQHEFLATLNSAGVSVRDFLRILDDATLALASTRDCFAREAFQVLLVERNNRERRLTAYFVQHGLAYEDAIDLVQTLYMNLYARGLRLYQPSVTNSQSEDDFLAFERWLFGGCARHLLLDWFRRRRGAGCRATEMEPLVSEPVSQEACPESQAMYNEETQRLRTAISRLPELDGALFRDYWEEGLRMEDLARKYNLAVSSVCRRLHQARETVQSALQGRGSS